MADHETLLAALAKRKGGPVHMSGDLIRVLLVDDHAVVRAGLKAVLGTAKDIDVVGEAKNGKEALAQAERLHPDVIVMDLSMDEMDGATATKALTASGSTSKILILTMHTEDEYLVPALEAGASGYLVKSAADRDLVSAVRTVANGDPYLQAGAARALAKEFKRREQGASERSQFEELSNREQEILKLVASGYSAPEIGGQLHISPKTVDTYKQRINEKLGLHHRSDYVKFALKLKLLES